MPICVCVRPALSPCIGSTMLLSHGDQCARRLAWVGRNRDVRRMARMKMASPVVEYTRQYVRIVSIRLPCAAFAPGPEIVVMSHEMRDVSGT